MEDVNDENLNNFEEEYDEIIRKVQQEEQRLIHDQKRNETLIPDIIKKGHCSLITDERAMKCFEDPNDLNNYSNYLSQRRDSLQSRAAAMIHGAQFISYAKLKLSTLKEEKSTKIVLSSIASTNPTLVHQHLNFLQQSSIKANSICARIDSLTLLYEWMLLNSNEIHVCRDVVHLFPSLFTFDR